MKSAVAVVFAVRVKTHAPVPVQGPLQPLNTDLRLGRRTT